ncbi:hypothetical protein CXB51_010358 [Gossypium anomalum]|uniref:Uncharacterized protein n=1 Tax=Gossypium anomalum TaxID=47600 RepID=A0A8J5Z2K9_9ROSI|nr:hypothetical protein CXB51_010358 [Gossypium anomalum]
MLSIVLRFQGLKRVSSAPVKSMSVALLTTSDFAFLVASWHFKGFLEEEEVNGNGIRFNGFI